MTTRAQIETEVVGALQVLIDKYTRAPAFKWVLVPSKNITEDGLGLSWNAWHATLQKLVPLLPKNRPYSRLTIGVMLVQDTHSKNLQSLRYWLVERLALIDQHNV